MFVSGVFEQSSSITGIKIEAGIITHPFMWLFGKLHTHLSTPVAFSLIRQINSGDITERLISMKPF